MSASVFGVITLGMLFGRGRGVDQTGRLGILNPAARLDYANTDYRAALDRRR
jgi:hypothetical protein